MSLLDRVQKQQGPDPNAPPDGAYVPQAGQNPRQGLAAATRSRTPFELQAERIKNRLQARLLENIDEREANILKLRYGLSGEDPLTLKEIGQRIGLTRERVRQLEHQALKKLKEAMDA